MEAAGIELASADAPDRRHKRRLRLIRPAAGSQPTYRRASHPRVRLRRLAFLRRSPLLARSATGLPGGTSPPKVQLRQRMRVRSSPLCFGIYEATVNGLQPAGESTTSKPGRPVCRSGEQCSRDRVDSRARNGCATRLPPSPAALAASARRPRGSSSPRARPLTDRVEFARGVVAVSAAGRRRRGGDCTDAAHIEAVRRRSSASGS